VLWAWRRSELCGQRDSWGYPLSVNFRFKPLVLAVVDLLCATASAAELLFMKHIQVPAESAGRGPISKMRLEASPLARAQGQGFWACFTSRQGQRLGWRRSTVFPEIIFKCRRVTAASSYLVHSSIVLSFGASQWTALLCGTRIGNRTRCRGGGSGLCFHSGIFNLSNGYGILLSHCWRSVLLEHFRLDRDPAAGIHYGRACYGV